MMTRVVDALDRVTFEDYPNNTLDVTYTYDDPSVAFSLGRLTKIERDGHAIDTTYDRFGRVLRDGALSTTYDKNGNRSTVMYPGSVSAIYTYDEVDRQSTLTLQRPGEPDLDLVTSASYEPSGPLASLSLGNGLSETRDYDTRYFPSAIQVDGGPAVLDLQYTTDNVGNITAIGDALNPTNDRIYAYQDFQDYLTHGDGPWGELAWTYDLIGNRLSEARDSVVDTYSYLPNAALGNSAQLDEIALGAGGTRAYAYDTAGNETQVDTAGDVVDRTYDDASRMSRQERPSASAATDFLYDGRGYLRLSSGVLSDSGSGIFCDGFETGDTFAWGGAGACSPTTSLLATAATYSSAGLLHGITEPGQQRYYIYFTGRPVAQVGTIEPLLYLVTDHLGTPILASDETGGIVWEGGFEPFGADDSGASSAGVSLRFPGQWVDQSWRESGSGVEVAYNVYRWYALGDGRYLRPDPLGAVAGVNLLLYAGSNPATYFDALALRPICCNKPWSQCWGDCLAARRLDYWKVIPFSALPKRILPPFRVPRPNNPLTSIPSSLGHLLGGRSTALGSALRTAGRYLSRIATPVTVFEGFYDAATIVTCTSECSSNPCQRFLPLSDLSTVTMADLPLLFD